MKIRTECTAEEIRKAAGILPGTEFVGMFSDPRINNGNDLPLLKPIAPKGRPGINSEEGWREIADKENRKSFISTFGREPIDRVELYTWVNSVCSDSEVCWE